MSLKPLKRWLVGLIFVMALAAGFVAVWYASAFTTIAWPWYCLIGGAVNMSVSIVASLVLDGRQAQWSEFSVPGQKLKFKSHNLPEWDQGWSLVPGRPDKASYWLLGFFVFTLVFLAVFQTLV